MMQIVTGAIMGGMGDAIGWLVVVLLEVTAWVMLVVAYFLPGFVAAGKKDALAIFGLNLVFGWLPPVWIGLLVWAIYAAKVAGAAVEVKYACPHCGKESPAGSYYCRACDGEMYPGMAG